MDAFGSLLDGPRARGAFLLRAVLDPPWSLRVRDEAPVTVVVVLAGEAWVLHDGAEPRQLRRGDLAIVRGPEHYTVADHPGTAPRVVIHPDQSCTTPSGESLSAAMALGVRTWGTGPDGATRLLVGTYPLRGEVGRGLVDALPALVVLPEFGWESPVVGLLAAEVAADGPGQDVVLDRLLDLLLVTALRDWFSRPGARPPAWYAAQSDPLVGPAVRALQDDPARPWTVGALAAEVGTSRSVLARRFTELVGEPPMAFLASWRLALAADLLRDTDLTLEAIARRVGYGSGFALSAAFRRVHGRSPREHRAAG